MKLRNWTVQQLRQAAKGSSSIRQVLLKLGLRPAGGNYTHITVSLKHFRVSTKHFKGQGWNKGLRGIGKPRLPLERILVRNSNYQSYKLKRRLFSAGLKRPRCELCGWAKYAPGDRIPLELDHINGRRNDNRLSNLRILCPNCHSLQTTHRGLNIHRGRNNR